jgi:small subunit ribosomal protein S1
VVLRIEHKDSLRNTKISLSIRQAGADPWTTIAEHLHVGDQVQGTITRLANFGAFVELIPGIEGLIHVSEMSWGKRINHPQDVVKAGDQVGVTILAIDETKRTISCTLKDVKNDPWNTIVEKFPVGAVVKGKVASQSKFGYFVDLDENFTGLLVFSNIAADRKGAIRVGSELEVTVDRIDLDNRRIGLSCGVAAERAHEEFAQAYMQEAAAKAKAKAAEKPESEFAEMLKKALKK